MRTQHRWFVPALALLLAGSLQAQIRITETRVLDTPSDGMWGYARFSPDGSDIYFSTLSYNGIWQYRMADGTVTELTRDEGSGLGYAVSPDGKNIAYRRTVRGERWMDRKQEIVVRDLTRGTIRTVASERRVSPPAFIGGNVTYVVGKDLRDAPAKPAGVHLLGIRDQKILLIVDGSERTIDPVGDGRYIWPSLSPDGRTVLAYDMGQGAVTSTTDGRLVQRLGRAEAPVWTRDGEWIISFSEENDGYRITGGDLQAVRRDGTERTQLTSTPDRIELFPTCSPVANEIVCHTLDGKLLLMTYTVNP